MIGLLIIRSPQTSFALSEIDTNCPGGSGGAPHQYARNESGGSLQCALLSWLSLTAFPAACGAGSSVQGIGATLTCAQYTAVTFNTYSTSCALASITQSMVNLGMTYTTKGSPYLHTIIFNIDWQLTKPKVSADTSTYQLAYGTGTAPACASTTLSGTNIGNAYINKVTTSSTATEQTTGNIQLHETVAISGLSASTAYWFEFKVTDSTADSWTYTNAQITVMEI